MSEPAAKSLWPPMYATPDMLADALACDGVNTAGMSPDEIVGAWKRMVERDRKALEAEFAALVRPETD